MESKDSFLRVRGKDIVNEQDEIVMLRGFNLGGWLNMENFIVGFPGTESAFRKKARELLGEQKAKFFFDRFLHYFIQERDIRFIKETGATVIRLPLNYRHFETDEKPFLYREEGFEILDRVISWCKIHKIYLILDLHSAQGWQNPEWHCDNPGAEALLWEHQFFQDRFVALWQELAKRYCNEPWIAGYNLLNEPVVPISDIAVLNNLYRRTTRAIREIDKKHIIFLDGNLYGLQLDQLDLSLDSNTVYSSHHYPWPGLERGTYPVYANGTLYAPGKIAQEYQNLTKFSRDHNLPVYIGEFGVQFPDRRFNASHLRLLGDILDIFEENSYHWTIWTYKDIGLMGAVYLSPESAWMLKTASVRKKKQLLGCDTWYHNRTIIGRQLADLKDNLFNVSRSERNRNEDMEDMGYLDWKLDRLVRGLLASELLLPEFVGQFRYMWEEEIDRMMQSCALENCVARKPLINLLRSFMGRNSS